MTDDVAVPRNIWRTVILAFGVLVAVNLAIIAIRSTRTETTVAALPAGIHSVNVCSGTVQRPQQAIDVQLDAGYDGELTLDGILALPRDEYEPRALDANEILWQPAAGHAFSEFPPGKHTLAIIFRATKGPDAGKTGSYTCTFNVG